MTKLTREIVHSLRNQGKTFSDIGRAFGVSRQYTHSLYTGYHAIYRKTDKFKMYNRHVKSHKPGAKLIKPCDYCLSMQNPSMTLSNAFH